MTEGVTTAINKPIMKKTFLLPGIFISLTLHAQEKRINVRAYINPAISISPIQHRIFNDGIITSQKLTKKAGISGGAGIEILKKLQNNFLLAGDFAYISKGNLEIYDTVYYSGLISGIGFQRIELPYIESTIFVEKQVILKNKKGRILFSSGLFFGLHASYLGRFILQGKGNNDIGNDFGFSCAVGIQKKRFFTKFDFKKGLINIKNDKAAIFKTNIIALKVGYLIN